MIRTIPVSVEISIKVNDELYARKRCFSAKPTSDPLESVQRNANVADIVVVGMR